MVPSQSDVADLRRSFAVYQWLLTVASTAEQLRQVRGARARLTSALIASGWRPKPLADAVGTSCDNVVRWHRHARKFEFDSAGLPPIPPPPAPPVHSGWTVDEIATHLRVDTTSVRRWIHSGWLQGSREGVGSRSAWRVEPVVLERLGVLEPLLTSAEYAEKVGVTARQVRVWVKQGRLSVIRLGGPGGPIRVPDTR